LNKIPRIFVFVLLVLMAGAHLANAKHNDDLILKLPAGWMKGNVAENRRAQTQIMQLIRPGDDIHNWNELLTELSYPKSNRIHKPADMLDALKNQREKECAGSTVWNVIAEEKNSITYEWHSQSCLGQPEQCEIAKILLGKNIVYFLQYAKKVKELSADERNTWLTWLSDAQLGAEP
jgi:hypothetical protein